MAAPPAAKEAGFRLTRSSAQIQLGSLLDESIERVEVESMKGILAIGIVMAVLVLSRSEELRASLQQATAPQEPGVASREKFGDPIEFERRDLPVTNHDLLILTKAGELLKDESVWNRADDRECKDDEATGKRSLFCALQKASIDVLGTYDHRRVALQEVRFAVEEATRGRDFEHRLRDFNNLPTTRLADVKAVLRVATDRVRSRLKAK